MPSPERSGSLLKIGDLAATKATTVPVPSDRLHPLQAVKFRILVGYAYPVEHLMLHQVDGRPLNGFIISKFISFEAETYPILTASALPSDLLSFSHSRWCRSF
jgi:hypothetical protein